MIDVKQIPDTNIVEMKFSGSISKEEFNQTIETFKTVIGQHGKIKVLEYIGELDTPPIPWSKFWDDFKFGFKNLSNVSHAAVVADQDWIRSFVNAWGPLFKAEIKSFELAEIEEAREWLRTDS